MQATEERRSQGRRRQGNAKTSAKAGAKAGTKAGAKAGAKGNAKASAKAGAKAAARRFRVQAPFTPAGDQAAAIRQLARGLKDGLHSQVLLGVTGSGKTYTVAKLVERVQRPTLVMAPNKTLAAQLYGEFRQFFPDNAVEYFVSYYDYYQPEAYVPSSDTYIEKDASINEHIEQMRLSATKALLEREDTLVVATVSAIYGIGAPGSYLQMVLHLVRGEEIDRQKVLRRLAELQYTRNDMEFHRGTYRVRGEVVDVFPAESAEAAIRLSLFDRELERIEFFDPLTGEILRQTPRVTIYPKTHYVTPREKILSTLTQIETDLKQRLRELKEDNKLLEAQRLEQRTHFDLEMIRELGYCTGIENYSRYLSGRAPGEPPPTLFDYLPQNTLVVVDESHVAVPQIGGMYRGDRSRKETLVEYGFRLPAALDNRPLRFDEWEGCVQQAIFVSATPARYEMEHADQVVEQVVRPTGLLDPQVEVRPAAGQVDDLMSEARGRAEKDERTLVTTLTKRMAEDLSEYLDEHGLRVRYLHSDINTVERVEIIRDLRLGRFDVLVGINLLREGLDMPEVSLVAIFDADREGYLRSESSLIQTMGRAARNANGAVILYADRITDSMQRAMAETERRRKRQLAHNKKHGIRPRTVQREVADIMEGARVVPGRAGKRGRGGRRTVQGGGEIAGEAARLAELPAQELGREIRRLEEAMYEHAANLEFEEAARLRDTLTQVRERAFVDPR